MANGFLGGSKGALIFAGGVVACAALVASTMGSQFIPKSDGDYLSEREANQPDVEGPKAAATPAAQQAAASDNVFGDFGGFATDDDLIDDTRGFDPTPGLETAIISNSDNDNGFAVEGTISANNSSAGTIVSGESSIPKQVSKKVAAPPPAPFGSARRGSNNSIPLSDLQQNPNLGKEDRPQKRPE